MKPCPVAKAKFLSTADDWRLVGEAVLIAVLFHAFLLLFFRYSPREGERQQEEPPPVLTLNLAAPENRALAQWIENHDPSLIAAPDHRFGYGVMAERIGQRAPVEDLPQPPLLAEIQELRPLAMPQFGRDLVTSLVWPETAAIGIPHRDKNPLSLITAYNGRNLPQATQFLQQKLAALAKSERPATSCAVEIAVEAPRSEGLPLRCRVVESSGNPALDLLALHAAQLFSDPWQAQAGGVFTVRWMPMETLAGERGEVKQ